MSVQAEGGVIRLAGTCQAAEAEQLLQLIQANPTATVDVTAASHVHSAVLQVLMAFAPPLAGPAADPFITRFVLPALMGAERPASPVQAAAPGGAP